MRALLVDPGPDFSVQDVATGYHEALEGLGLDVKRFALGDYIAYHGRALAGTVESATIHESARLAAFDLRAACFDMWPDIVIVVSAFFLPPECYRVIRSRRIKVGVIFTESPYEDDGQTLIAPHADACVINDPTNLDRFREVNPDTIYLPHAYRPGVHCKRPASDPYRSDFCFVGTGYPSRVEFFEACDFEGVDVALGGNWQDLPDESPLTKYLINDREVCLANADAMDLYASCQASANIYRIEAQRPELSQGWAMGPREVELAASETFFLTEARGENREVLPMVPTFDGPDEFSEKLRWWLNHPGKRDAVVRKARRAVQDRTFAQNAKRLLSLAGL